jgi:hypothetical protein
VQRTPSGPCGAAAANARSSDDPRRPGTPANARVAAMSDAAGAGAYRLAPRYWTREAPMGSVRDYSGSRPPYLVDSGPRPECGLEY